MLLWSESVEVGERVFCCGKGLKRREREITWVGLMTILYTCFAI